MFVGIVGSRGFGACDCPAAEQWPTSGEKPHPEGCNMLRSWLLVLSIITRLAKQDGFEGIVTGGAEGADRMAEDAAKLLDVKCLVYKPEGGPQSFSQRALERNSRIVRKLGVNGWLVALFAAGLRSPGTSDTLRKAKMSKLQTHVYQTGKGWSRV